MKKRILTLVLSGLALAVSSGAARVRQSERSKMTEEKQTDREFPFACSLTALNAAQRENHRRLSKEVRAAVRDISELRNGFAFRFAGDGEVLAKLAEWISLERRCCPFFAFGLDIGEESRPIWLRITGRDGVKAFMRSEFAIK